MFKIKIQLRTMCYSYPNLKQTKKDRIKLTTGVQIPEFRNRGKKKIKTCVVKSTQKFEIQVGMEQVMNENNEILRNHGKRSELSKKRRTRVVSMELKSENSSGSIQRDSDTFLEQKQDFSERNNQNCDAREIKREMRNFYLRQRRRRRNTIDF